MCKGQNCLIVNIEMHTLSDYQSVYTYAIFLSN